MGKVQALPDETASTHGLFFGDQGDTADTIGRDKLVKEFFFECPPSTSISVGRGPTVDNTCADFLNITRIEIFIL